MKHIIPKGVLHARKNNIPASLNLGKKGIPVVQVKQGGEVEVEKVAEVEHEEWTIDKETASQIEEMVYNYEKTGDQRILLLLGKFVRRELLKNTSDNTGKFLTDNYKKEANGKTNG